MQDILIDIKDLSKTFKIQTTTGFKNIFKPQYKVVDTLKNISLAINKGEFVALLGPNGAGKSTLIKIMIGVLQKTQGNLRVLGIDPLEEREKIVQKLGIVFGQRSRMWFDLPVKDSFELTKRLYIDGYPGNNNKSLQEWEKYLIDSIEIGHLMDQQVKKLSLGEKMRCELVNTLLYNPDLIFLDEPTIGLDIVSKQKIREALKKLHNDGKTIFLTSHDTGDIESLCSRVIVINNGTTAVDLPMNEFIKLADETVISVKTAEELDGSKMQKFINNGSFEILSEYEAKVVCKKTKF
jgi:ABC-2 type transport system ATP-binding protein